MKRLVIVCLGMLAFFASCTSEEEKQRIAEEKAMFKSGFEQLIDSVKIYKQLAFTSDENKLKDMRMLCEEIATMKTYDIALLDSVKAGIQAMADAKYTEQTYTDAAKMEAYDAVNESTIEKIQRLVATAPDFNNYARGRLLYKDIMTAENNDFHAYVVKDL